MADAAGPPRLRVLVTNDDGIEAPALALLAAALSAAGHEVQVAAPAVEYTGCGASIGRVSASLLIATRAVSVPGAPGVAALAVDAPPALAVIAGLQGLFGARPDVIVSGTNSGFNTGPTVLHSGTVGAALTAAANGVPGIALSTERGAHHGFVTAARVCAENLVVLIGAAGAGGALNVNVPDLPLKELAGVRPTRLGQRSLISVMVTAEPAGVRVHRTRAEEAPDDESELAALHRGYISVTRLFGGVRDLVPSPADSGALAALVVNVGRADAACAAVTDNRGCPHGD